MENNISEALKETLKSESNNLALDYVELGLDKFLDEGIFRDIPFVRTAISLFKIGKTVHDALYVRNLFIFLQRLKEKNVSQDNLNKHKKCCKNSDQLEKELEYVLVYCDRMVEQENVKYVSELYFSLLEGKIGFEEFVLFLSVLDNLLPGDIDFMLKNSAVSMNINFVNSRFLRLSGLGLMLKTNGKLIGTSFGNVKNIETSLMDVTFTRSNFGSEFLTAIGK